jgi:filamentous hemagglutinin
VTLKGTIDSAADLQVRSDGDLDNQAALFASGALSLQAAQALRTAADVQARTVTLQAAQASNAGACWPRVTSNCGRGRSTTAA